MRRSLLLLGVLLAACTAGSQTLVVSLETTMTEDTLAIPHTKAILHLAGAINADVDLGDIQGELVVVDPAMHPQYEQTNGDVVAVLTAWFAGQGEEIIVTQFHDPHMFTVERRYGDEEGTCTSTDLIADLPLPGDVTVTLEGFEPTVEQSSIQFCHEKLVQEQ